MDVAYFLLLSCLGLAATVQAQDCSKPVPGPNMDLDDKSIVLEKFPNGIKVNFTCSPGYIPAGGSSSITCTAGTWSPVKLKCEKKNCGSAGEVLNGQIDYPEGTEFGDKAVVTCDTGYNLVGPSKITCEDKGWSSRLPVCEVVTCDPPPMIVNGAFIPDNEEYSYREVVEYSCNKDYTLNGSKSLTCSEDGTFKPGPPKCVMVQCENPDVDHGVWAGGSRPPYRFSSTVTLVCSSGYNMKGESTQTCDINSKWSPGLPTCEQITTTTTTTTTTKKPTALTTNSTAATTTSTTTKKPTALTTNSTAATTTTTTSTTTKTPTALTTNSTAATTTSTTTKTPTDGRDPTPNGGHKTALGWGLGISSCALVGVCLCCYFGSKKKKSQCSRRRSPGKEETKVEAELEALSSQQ